MSGAFNLLYYKSFLRINYMKISQIIAGIFGSLLLTAPAIASMEGVGTRTGVNYGEFLPEAEFVGYVCNNTWFATNEVNPIVSFETDETDFVHELAFYGNSGPDVLTCDAIGSQWDWIDVYVGDKIYTLEGDMNVLMLHSDSNRNFVTSF